MAAPRATFAPVAIFAYRRVEPLIKVLDALERCPEFAASDVYIFSDGAKTEMAQADVEGVRAMVRARLRPNMHLVEAAANKGLARSIIGGVERLCNDYGRVIVIEDDLIVSPVTLTWFNTALAAYEHDERVWQISAHQHDVPEFRGRETGVVLNLSTSWGWATWKRVWDRFDAEAKGADALARDPTLAHRFDIDGSYPYTKMLERQQAGTVDSWAIRFWWSMFRAGGLGVFPPRSLVTNIGLDGAATHLRTGWLHSLINTAPAHRDELTAPRLPSVLLETPADRAALARSLRGKTWARGLKVIASKILRAAS